MTPERWRQIEEIFHEALELDPSARNEFLKASANGDDELRVEVKKLLDQFDEASSFIEQPLYDSAKSGVLEALLDDSNDDPMVGKLLGNYRIEREIGRGGMGAVYEAYRADGEFRLRVALKVVKRGIDTDFVLKRFRNERQILAALDHPFITRLIDGGTTDDGRPYFVMEYIDGLTLYRYCDRNRLSVNDRLRLFCRVTEAVEYAHQKLIIHRDLKPSNIFITHDGGPRLLDFGIAKLLDPELASDTLQPTATALRMMTVDYASPEQVRGEKVTTATDIYSLGVILFELLTGHRPYKIKSRSQGRSATRNRTWRALWPEAPTLICRS
jgi:serine/threonine protein kinase